MKTATAIRQLFSWLKTTELFQNSEKLLPGRWFLYEYYTEPGKELIHIEEKQLLEAQQTWIIDFKDDRKFTCEANLPVMVVSGIKSGNWQRVRNFLTLKNSSDPADQAEFQFAIEKENLKLLKKDSLGKIEVFGFFRKP